MGSEQSSQSKGASRASSEAEGIVTTSNKRRRKAKRPRKTHPAGGDADDAEVGAGAHHPPVTMEASANTFDASKPGTGKSSANKAARTAAAPASQSKDAADQVMITDALTDVRQKFHINPKEIGHGVSQ